MEVDPIFKSYFGPFALPRFCFFIKTIFKLIQKQNFVVVVIFLVVSIFYDCMLQCKPTDQ